MNQFRTIDFLALSRNEIESIALATALELKFLKQTQAKRDSLDLQLSAFAAGICFAILAFLFGISLH